jgi:hypothetical protein
MRLKTLVLLGGACLVLLVSLPAHSSDKPIETFTAVGVNMQRGSSSTITIAITRWSTDEERAMLLQTLKEKGQEGLTAALFKMPQIGYFKLPNTRGYDLKYARSTQLPDGTRRVVVATDRTITFVEAVGSTRSRNYDFSVAELRIPADGKKGEGKLIPAALIAIEGDQIAIESYGSQPTRLMSITAKAAK